MEGALTRRRDESTQNRRTPLIVQKKNYNLCNSVFRNHFCAVNFILPSEIFKSGKISGLRCCCAVPGPIFDVWRPGTPSKVTSTCAHRPKSFGSCISMQIASRNAWLNSKICWKLITSFRELIILWNWNFMSFRWSAKNCKQTRITWHVKLEKADRIHWALLCQKLRAGLNCVRSENEELLTTKIFSYTHTLPT